MSNRFIVPPPDDSLQTFQSIQQASNKNWERIKLDDNVYGFQIQPATKWREGLTDAALAEFEKLMGYEFPPALRNYYLTMNGLDAPGINIYGSSGHPATYSPIYYSYPDDFHIIQETIDWVLEANHISPQDLPLKASRIFPIMGHRFLLIDDPLHRVLSMYGDDIIYWSDSLSKLLVKEIFPSKYYHPGFDNYTDTKGIRFWLD